jgi:hypothetical protein
MPQFSASILARPMVGSILAEATDRSPFVSSRELELLLARRPRQRSKLRDFGPNLHCSIIGTCLTTAELRQVFLKIGRREAVGASEHDIHASAVLVASKHPDGAKLLNKALDRRYRAAIGRFDKARTAAEVRALWREASKSGDIPGAYWAALTHPATTEALIGEIFAEVHMLSHLVGAANRADIRRLRRLEEEKAALEARLARKEEQLAETGAARDRALRELEARIKLPPVSLPPQREDEGMAIELKSRLARCETHCERLDAELTEARAALGVEGEARRVAEAREAALREELEAIEESLGEIAETDALPRLDLTVLYVGGKPSRIGHLRMLAERAGAVFLHHDGGIEDRSGQLPGLVSRADAVLFPVDCVGHVVMLQVKRLCRQAGKKFVPLRGAGLAPFCAALKDRALFAVEEG